MSPRVAAAFTDLDRTLVYSPRAAGTPDTSGLVCVEHYRGAPASFLTPTAAHDLRALDEAAVWVPTTTRTAAQYRRLELPRGPRSGPDRALCANGGVLLVDGEPDPDWDARVRATVGAAAPADEVAAGFRRRAAAVNGALDGGVVGEVRDAEGLFHYAVVDRARLPGGWLEDFRAWADGLRWRTSVQGGKLYCLPDGLTKSAAARRVAREIGATTLLAAGDSLLDADLLEIADAAIRPAHGELAAAGWTAPHVEVTVGTGVAAGEEIAAWLRRAAVTGLRRVGRPGSPPAGRASAGPRSARRR